jgi:glutamate synthase (NADPH/NADH) large chain
MLFVGKRRNLLAEGPEHCKQLKLPHPVLTNEDLHRLRAVKRDDYKVATVGALFDARSDNPADALARGLADMLAAAEKAIADGASLLVLSDRGVSADKAPIPSLLATSALHHGLLARGLRGEAGILVESGEPREVMHFCLLCGYGASAVNPYLAFEALRELERRGDIPKPQERGEYVEHYINAVKKGILKTMSKMGISTLRSYRAAQLFEILGLNRDVVDKYFPGTPARLAGAGLDIIAAEIARRQELAYGPRPAGALPLVHAGEYQYRLDGEQHGWTPETIQLLQHAVRRNDPVLYEQYAEKTNAETKRLRAFRGLLDFKAAESVPLEDVEPAAEIARRFCTGAMSHGSISKETHETLALAMNRLGAASNTGEGGEDPARYAPGQNGDSLNSAIKQIASARFGVTMHYLSEAKELQIKVAQGAKPGEGGQLPGFKVTDEIARLRHSTPGVS